MTVYAPFAFARINRWVYEPRWGALVSHDVPFKDGLSGSVEVEIEAMTPLLIGGPRRKATRRLEGEVWPFQLADGRYAIPASSLQGMVRSILEVAAFGRLGQWIDERRVGYRDLGNSTTAGVHYKARMTTLSGGAVTQHAKAGWLIRRSGETRIVPCAGPARIRLDEIRLLKGLKGGAAALGANDTLGQRSNAEERYDWFLGASRAPRTGLDRRVYLDPPAPHTHSSPAVKIRYQRAFASAAAGRTAVDGTLVLTGKPRPGTGARDKKFEFIFHGPNRPGASPLWPAAHPILDDVWRDFNDIHGAVPGRAENPALTFWREELESERPIPVFYLHEGGEITTVMMAFMGKTALRLSTHDDLRNSGPAHAAQERNEFRPDLPCVIFGRASDDETHTKDDNVGFGLKRRAAFDLAVAALPEGEAVRRSSITLLLGPKPSYFPIYIRQPSVNRPGVLPNGMPHAVSGTIPAGSGVAPSHLRPEHLEPELAGVKMWPAPANDACPFPRLPAPPPPPRNQLPNRLTHIVLNALPVGTRATTTLRFHNLRPVELGAVLWALTFGEDAAMEGQLPDMRLRHRLGMGKPYCLGSVRIALRNLSVRANDPAKRSGENVSIGSAIEEFTKHMQAVYEAARKQASRPMTNARWIGSVQVKALLKAADPAQNPVADPPYMAVGRPQDPGTYVGERSFGHFLPAYVEGDEFERLLPEPPPRPAGLPQSTRPGGGSRPAPQPPAPAGFRFQVGSRVSDRDGNEGRVMDREDRSGQIRVRFDFGDTEWVPINELKER